MSSAALRGNKEEIKNNEWIIFSTSKNNIPHSIVVMPSKVKNLNNLVEQKNI